MSKTLTHLPTSPRSTTKREAADIKTRRLLPIKSGILRLYAKRKEKGKELLNVRGTNQDETTKIQEYIRMMGYNDDLLSESQR